MSQLRFDGKVVVVTGAGGGLGRQYALEFAARGAKVVVNDLGCTQDGNSQSSKSADVVVQEIRREHGEAVADYHSVENGDMIIATAMKTYGRVDILINNAGILRDRSFLKMSEDEWSLVHRVHLYGAFKTTQAAWKHMRQQKYGKVIMTTSNAGLYGNYGQANYSAAKMGLVGLSNTLSKEGAKYNIHCNTIAPLAGSRLTEGIMPEDVFERLKPDQVAPFVLYLCHDSCHENGAVVEAAGGWGGKVRLQRTKGVFVGSTPSSLTPESVRDNWAKLSDYEGAVYPQGSGEDLMSVMQRIVGQQEGQSGESQIPLSALLGKKFETKKVQYSFKDVILYALGIGINVESSHEQPLQYLYEGSQEFAAFPTFAVIPAQLLHGEQFIEWYKPLPTNACLSLSGQVTDILDKGKGALVIVDIYAKDEHDESICRNQFSIFLRGSGGFGGKRSSQHSVPVVDAPSRSPDAVIEERIPSSQAALYRLNGDFNPLHIDPDFASLGGFSRPILHGLCSMGYAGRHVLSKYAPGNPSAFKRIKTRFLNPVLPGQTVVTHMWQEGTRVHFVTKVKESGVDALAGGYVDLEPSAAQPQSIVPAGGADGAVKSSVFFNELRNRLNSDSSIVKKVKAIFQWNVTQNGKVAGVWTLDFKSTSPRIYAGECKTKADAIVTVEDDDLMKIALNQLNPQQAFTSGKLKAKGNVMLLMRIGQLFREHSKL